ncbi:MAG: hypothetical protein GY710_02440 [Desulfobacteraceae bacterium]|nr:hypothetical protein [Desulfobacteraceae bacterium]
MNQNINKSAEVKDLVMKDGMSITINNPDCFSLTVTAGKNLLRSYTWNDGTRSVKLIPRKTKWYGAFGAYYPGSGFHWKMHDGINRLLADEAIVDYKSYEHLLCAISSENDECKNKYHQEVTNFDFTNFDFENTLPLSLYSDKCRGYTSDGLFVSVKKAKGPGTGGTLYVTINQITLNGKPVKSLPGSSDDRIKITYQ